MVTINRAKLALRAGWGGVIYVTDLISEDFKWLQGYLKPTTDTHIRQMQKGKEAEAVRSESGPSVPATQPAEGDSAGVCSAVSTGQSLPRGCSEAGRLVLR